MSGKRAIYVAGQAKPLAPYTPAILAGNTLYVSGQIAQRPDGTFPETAGEQTRVVMEKIKALVEAAGLTMAHVVDATVLLADMAYYGEMNTEYGKWFEDGVPPARAAFAVKELPLKALVEIKAVAVSSLPSKV